MSDQQIGIDVDHYGNKSGGDTLKALESKLGPLPATAVSTARDDKISGIRFYRVPAGRKWKESAGKDIEIIQRVQWSTDRAWHVVGSRPRRLRPQHLARTRTSALQPVCGG